MYLVDTDVLSAAAPGQWGQSASLVAGMDAHSDDLFISAVTVAEICDAIAKLQRTGSAARAKRLEDWLELVLHLYAERALPFDIAAARVAGALTDRAHAAGHTPGFADVAVAATAANSNLVVPTRNLRHFGPLQVRAHDPFEGLPPSHDNE